MIGAGGHGLWRTTLVSVASGLDMIPGLIGVVVTVSTAGREGLAGKALIQAGNASSQNKQISVRSPHANLLLPGFRKNLLLLVK